MKDLSVKKVLIEYIQLNKGENMGAPRITFLSATFDEETNLSTVAVKYLNKVFYGYSKPHPEDLEHLSKVRGGRIAEIKAQKKAYEYVKEENQK